MLQALLAQLDRDGQVTLAVRVRPGAKHTRVVGFLADGSLKVEVKAAPEDGKANEALVRLFEDECGAAVTLLAGGSGRRKLLRLSR